MVYKPIVARLERRVRRLFSFQPYLGLLEYIFLLRQYKAQQPQLFILGLPRSGTTLVYQYIVHRLRVSYFTNRAGQYYLSPCFVTYLQRENLDRYYSDFQSHYGKVQGPLSPREAGAIWRRFFSLEEYVRYQDMSSKTIQTLQNTIGCIEYLFGNLPFVNKNVKHMLRIDALNNVFPDAHFLVVERELSQVAVSVLRGRYANLKDPTQWWSVKPPNYVELENLPVTEQIVLQLISLQKRMESDFSQIAPKRMIRLNYEAFCLEPEIIIHKLSNILGGVESRNEVETCFEPSNKLPQNDEEKRLINLVKQYEAT